MKTATAALLSTFLFALVSLSFPIRSDELDDLPQDEPLTEEFILRTVWLMEKEIQLQIQNKDVGYLINLSPPKKNIVQVDLVIYTDGKDHAHENFPENFKDTDLKALILGALANSPQPHFRIYGDNDAFFGMETDFRKRLHENDQPYFKKFLPKLEKLVRYSNLKQTSVCQELLTVQ